MQRQNENWDMWDDVVVLQWENVTEQAFMQMKHGTLKIVCDENNVFFQNIDFIERFREILILAQNL